MRVSSVASLRPWKWQEPPTSAKAEVLWSDAKVQLITAAKNKMLIRLDLFQVLTAGLLEFIFNGHVFVGMAVFCVWKAKIVGMRIVPISVHLHK